MRAANAWIDARVEATRDVAPDIRQFELRPNGGAVPWGPGSNLNVTVMVSLTLIMTIADRAIA